MFAIKTTHIININLKCMKFKQSNGRLYGYK